MRVQGVVPGDAKWEKMRRAWEACRAAGVEPPDDVSDFFEGEAPDSYGMVVDLPQAAVEEYKEDMVDGYEVDLTLVPDKVKRIRFTCNY